MQLLSRIIRLKPPSSSNPNLPKYLNLFTTRNPRLFSTGWDDTATTSSTWSTGLTKDHFDGKAVGHQITPPSCDIPVSSPVPVPETIGSGNRLQRKLAEIEKESRLSSEMLNNWEKKEREMSLLLRQIEEPGARGSYLKDSEKAEMYKKHKADPEVYTVEKLAQEYRIMRQRVCAILWLKENEEEEEKKRGEPLDDAVELLLDNFPDLFCVVLLSGSGVRP